MSKGICPCIPGGIFAVKGQWGQHKEFGEQFIVEGWQSEGPKILLGVERFLGSGLLKGIGPATAKKIVKEFGLDYFRYYSKYTGTTDPNSWF